MNKITWTTKATKQLIKLDNRVKKSVVAGVDTLADFSQSQNVKALRNHKYDYRLRVGSYRVMFNYDGQVKIVKIEEVKKRDGNTY